MSDTDPFPRERLSASVRRMPRYGKLAWRLGRDPLVGRARRVAVLAAAGYLFSPIDAVPGFIPVIGQLDDIAVMLAAIRFAMAGLDAGRRREHLDAVGLEDGDLVEDLKTIGSTTAWTLRAGRADDEPGGSPERGARDDGLKAGWQGVNAGRKRLPAIRGRGSRRHPDAGSGI